MYKRCSRCGETKPTSAFNKRSDAKDGLQNFCKLCNKTALKKHYKDNYDYYSKRNKRRKLTAREYVNSIKSSIPCSDCQKCYPPYVMDFDPRDSNTKNKEIAKMVAYGNSLAFIQKEIDKCDLVCANCHRIRTHGGRSGVV